MVSLLTRGDYHTTAVHSNSVHHYHKKIAGRVTPAVEVDSGESLGRQVRHKMGAMTLKAHLSMGTLNMKASYLLPRL